MRDEKQKCISCNKEQAILIAVETEDHSFFMQKVGVCQECIINKDINKVCNEYELRKVNEHIRDNNTALEQFEEEKAVIEKRMK